MSMAWRVGSERGGLVVNGMECSKSKKLIREGSRLSQLSS